MASSGQPSSTFVEQIASMAFSLASYARLPVLASSGIAAVVSGLLYFKQNELIYPRNLPPGARSQVPKPSQFGISDYEDLTIPTPDGESLNAYFIRPSNKQRAKAITVLMFHGNAGNIGHRVPIARVLEESIGCNVLMLEYRGYGLSTGVPNEEGLVTDAQAGVEYIRQREETKDSKIIIYGQSIGGAVSIQLVAKHQNDKDITALILENTFTTMRKLIPSAFPPARFLAPLCHQRWLSEDILPKIKNVPILFLSGLKDEIIPPAHMRHLFTICQAKKKIWKELPNGSHNDTVAEPDYFKYIAEFIRDEVIEAGHWQKE
ncbi:MAG: hypothetical protein M1827_003096 [Pycnora praestabilis]|nr:MAG: hypothetical protein M1827_003096 [Pycnora praestabilis]